MRAGSARYAVEIVDRIRGEIEFRVLQSHQLLIGVDDAEFRTLQRIAEIDKDQIPVRNHPPDRSIEIPAVDHLPVFDIEKVYGASTAWIIREPRVRGFQADDRSFERLRKVVAFRSPPLYERSIVQYLSEPHIGLAGRTETDAHQISPPIHRRRKIRKRQRARRVKLRVPDIEVAVDPSRSPRPSRRIMEEQPFLSARRRARHKRPVAVRVFAFDREIRWTDRRHCRPPEPASSRNFIQERRFFRRGRKRVYTVRASVATLNPITSAFANCLGDGIVLLQDETIFARRRQNSSRGTSTTLLVPLDPFFPGTSVVQRAR